MSPISFNQQATDAMLGMINRVDAVTTVRMQRSWLVKATTTGDSLNKAIGVQVDAVGQKIKL